MSSYATRSMGNEWSPYRLTSPSTTPLGYGYQGDVDQVVECGSERGNGVESRPILRSHKSFPHTLGTATYSPIRTQSPLSQVANPNRTDEYSSALRSRTVGEIPLPSTMEPKHGRSAPNSPISKMSVHSAEADGEHDGQQEEDEDFPMSADLEDDSLAGAAPKSATERRADRRKMKRFRLTHNQTRFLMSEFARQAHPDAAQRERLSREIPGLSPRQVQVWFQNRRAKLKRLTSDDQERMMKSRALPEDFDMTHALHSPFNGVSSSYSTPVVSPASYASTFGDGGMIRPLMMDGLKRQSTDESTISPISMSSANYYTPPGSVPASENLSPISPVSERSNFAGPAMSQNSSCRGTNPFNRSNSVSTTYHTYPHIPKLQIHDRVSRTRAESLASPLRSSMSYTANASEFGDSQSFDNAMSSPHGSSTHESSEPARSMSFDAVNLSYNTGFSQGPLLGFQSAALARPRPTVTTFPPGLDLRPQFRPLLPLSNFPHVPFPPSFQSAPLAAPQDFQLPQPTNPYQTATINTSYTITTYNGPGSYVSEEPPVQGRIVEEQAIDEYPSEATTSDSRSQRLPNNNSNHETIQRR